ncbi:flagellar protein FlaG [Marinobacterium lutimaris]|uniref:Flagellar protein FlaG n=1 Tax=Marinobacterium lutimaris TaxID=568106 RepID=A0A1H6BCP7_9GAMM|nr:flagellar protein FlaG [Marinobacterium lutimaris]SEG58569.1 flagellar protein FlaG [Marinobacterium lutimaris]
MTIDASGLNSNNTQLLPQSSVSSRQLPESADIASNASVPVRTLNASTEAVQQSGAAEQPGPTAEDLQAAVEKMNQLMDNTNRSLRFAVDDSTSEMVVKVIDMTTDEVVRQIPTEEQLKFSEFLEGMVGLIFDERA